MFTFSFTAGQLKLIEFNHAPLLSKDLTQIQRKYGLCSLH